MCEHAPIPLEPIGVVRREGDTCRLEIALRHADGLKEIEGVAALDVLYWMHELSDEDRRQLLVHPQGNRSRPKQGVFSLRSPMRPNPIGVTRVELIEREGTALVVRGLDAHDGSPIIDIKCARAPAADR